MTRIEISSEKEAKDRTHSLILAKSDKLEQIPVILKTYHNLVIKKSDKQVNRWIKEHIKEIRQKYSKGDWKNTPIFRGYINLHDQYSMTKGIPASSEILIDLILQAGSIPNINTFVNIYNVISAFTGLSMGAHDIDRLKGTPELRIIEKDSAFTVIGARGKDIARKGEYGYVDAAGVICRMDIKQCERTKITENTRHVLTIFQGHENLDVEYLQKGVAMLDEAIGMLESIL
jgi:DNA/RNA-binding domain of Phe-tRNA-synthetase-like protein